LRRSLRLASSWGLWLVLACGGHGVTAPPPPPPPLPVPALTAVQLVTARATIFLGRRLPLAVLVSSVTDVNGQLVSDAALSATTSASWIISHDTIVAPTFETIGTIQVIATRGSSHVTSGSVALVGVVNLDTLHLSGSPTMCRMIYRPGHVSWVFDDTVGPVDSIRITPVSDSIPYHYLGTSGSTGTPPLSYVLGFTKMSVIAWLSGSEVIYGSQPPYIAHYQLPDTAYYLTPRGIGIQWQVPDTFFFSFPQDPLSNAPLTWAVRHSPTTYGASGLAFCPLVSVGTYWTADSILLTSH